MKNKYIVTFCILLYSMGLFAQSSWLAPETSYKTGDIFTDKAFSCHDIIGDSLYAIDSDGLYSYDLNTLEQKCNYGKAPATYTGAWVSFVTADPNGKRIWVGYTVSGLTDDRIFSVDIATQTWTHVATLPGNFDMEIYDSNYYVSGLNKEGWNGTNDINCISLLDTTGNNLHKKLIEIGGNSTGLAIDALGNVYNAKYDPTGTETYMYQWSVDSVQKVIDATDGSFLTTNSGNQITAMPNNGPYDCDVDDAGNLLFNCNNFADGSFLAVWNGSIGNAHNYTKIGTYGGSSFAWFSMLKATGDITKNGKAYMINFGDPIAEIYLSAPPQVIKALGTVSAYDNDANIKLNLNNHFADSDDTVAFTYEITSNSFDSVAIATIVDDTLIMIDFLKVGQTNIYVKATSNGQSVTDKLIVGVQLDISGNYTVSNFENLTLGKDSYWNGSDGTGGFDSGLAYFPNDYNDAFGSWSGWAYSNMTNDSTPGYTNQYSAITAAGVDTLQSGGKNYGVSFVPTDWMTSETLPVSLNFIKNSKHEVKGLYVTNSTYASLSMEQGDAFAKKFGGIDGNDPDWFKLSVWGLKDGIETDTVEFFLADYRFDDNTKDYIIKSWQWFELSTLGKIDSLMFTLSSSDVGMWGINTPAFFCVDNINILPDDAPVVINPIADIIENPDSYDKEINLSNVFTDSDDKDSSIQKSIASNSNTDVVSASVNGDILTIDFLSNGISTLVIEGLSNGKSAYDTIQITVNNDQHPFVANPITDLTISEDAPTSEISLENVFSDDDNDDSLITKSIVSTVDVNLMSLNIENNILYISLKANQYGESEVVIEANSNGLTVTDTFNIIVNAVDDAPYVANTIANITLSEDDADSQISLTNVFSDIDNDDALITKSIISTSHSNIMTLTINNNNLDISLKANQFGETEVIIEANSNGLTITDTFNIIVNQVNDKPELIGTIEDVTVDKNANDKQIDLSNLFTDIDNDELVLSVSENSNESLVSTQISENILTLSFLDNQYGDATITIMANDGIEYVSTSFNVTVNNTTGFSNKDELNINIYPNPTKDYIIIKSPFAIKRIVLMNNYGIIQQVQKPGNGNTEFKLNLISLPTGIYFINIEGNNSQFTKSIIKQ